MKIDTTRIGKLAFVLALVAYGAIAAPDIAVSLNWQPGIGPTPTSYRVYCSADGNYRAATPHAVTDTSLLFAGFPDLAPFDCVVTAIFPQGESQFSPPSAPKVQCTGGSCWPLDTVPPSAPGVCAQTQISYTVIPNPNAADGSRPLNKLRDPSQPYSATNKLVPLSPEARVAPNTACDATPLVVRTSAGYWLWTTNAAGIRGIALCQSR